MESTSPRRTVRLLACANALIALAATGRSDALSAQSSQSTQNVAMKVPPGEHTPPITAIGLKDPVGKLHTRQEVSGKVVVAIFSVPTSGEGDTQKKWSKLLADHSNVPSKAVLILIEDMTQAGAFKGMAQDKMKSEFKPDSRPLLLLDQKGDVTKRFDIPKGKTQILIFDKKGTLRDVEANLDSEETTLHRVKTITAKLLA
jgi:hypothetical protein